MNGIKINIDQNFVKIKDRINKELLNKFGENSKYIFSSFEIDEGIKKNLSQKSIFNIISDISENISNFKNLNFFKKNEDNLKLDADINNNKIFSFVQTAVEVLKERNINLEDIKKYLLSFLDFKKISNILENKYIVNNIDKTFLENIKNKLTEINSNFDNIDDYITKIKEIKENLSIEILNSKLFNQDNTKPSDVFLDIIFNKEIDIINVYKICSFVNCKDFYETRGKTTFFYKNGFLTNKTYNVIIDILESDFNNIKSFDGMILGFSPLNGEFIFQELNNQSGYKRSNIIRVANDSIDKIEKNIGKINPILDLFYLFKGLKFKELGNNNNVNKLFIIENNKDSILEEKILKYIKDIKKYQGNMNFYNTKYIHNDLKKQEEIEQKFNETKKITFDEFLYYCNFGNKFLDKNGRILDKEKIDKITKNYSINDLDFLKHKINFINGNFKELINIINNYENIIIADFETTCLNEFKDGDIITMAFGVYDKNGILKRTKSYYIEEYKKNITDGALEVFNYEDYKKNKKISRKDFIEGIKTLFKKENLFVFHNGYNFDIEILKSNFLDLGETIKGMNVLDSIHLFREYYKSIEDKNYDIYSYSLDSLSKNLNIKNNRDPKNHNAIEDVEILADLFFKVIGKK